MALDARFDPLKLHEMKIIPRVLGTAGLGNARFGSAPDGTVFPKMDHVTAACSATVLPRFSGGYPAKSVSLLLPYIRHMVRGGIAVETVWCFLGRSLH